MSDLTKTLQILLADTRANAQRDNDLIYNAVPTPEATLPVIDKVVVATAIPIQEVYSTPDVQKVIGPDLFTKLVPLSVHESASVYSEEKAKVVRKEVEACDAADEELRVGLESLGLPGALKKWKDALAGEGGEGGGGGVPQEVEVWADEIESAGGIQGIETLFAQLDSVKAAVGEELNTIRGELDAESRECEAMRVCDVAIFAPSPYFSIPDFHLILGPVRTSLGSRTVRRRFPSNSTRTEISLRRVRSSCAIRCASRFVVDVHSTRACLAPFRTGEPRAVLCRKSPCRTCRSTQFARPCR